MSSATNQNTPAAPAGTLRERYEGVMQRVADAARRNGKRPEDIIVVAVTKYAEMDDIRELMQLGHVDFGESRVQQLAQRASIMNELVSRAQRLPEVSASRRETRPGEESGLVRWHMVGHLQRNKVKKLIGLVRLIHSVDSLRLVEEIQAHAHRAEEPVEVLVQVNCSDEEQKYGCAVAAAGHLCDQINSMVDLRVRGLMTMAPLTDDPGRVRYTFERCADLYEDILRRGYGGEQFNILSMGMSGDFETAIDCGANMVRIGTAIFGERQLDGDEDEDN